MLSIITGHCHPFLLPQDCIQPTFGLNLVERDFATCKENLFVTGVICKSQSVAKAAIKHKSKIMSSLVVLSFSI
jgi:hypothetical protein